MSERKYPIMQAIVTKYIGPTNTRPSRVKARAYAKSLTLSWDHALGVEANHEAAARALAETMGWQAHWFAGGLPDNDGFVYVQTPGLLDITPAFKTT